MTSSKEQVTSNKGAEIEPKEPQAEVATSDNETIVAKAGKRSTKAIKESEEKQAKEERKNASEGEPLADTKPKHTQKPPRSRLERRSKKYRDIAKLIDQTKEYSLAEAIDLAIKTSPVKFDASVELHFNLGVDPKQADQNIRDQVVLPAGTGKDIRVAVFAEPDDAKKAVAAGADIAGDEEFLAQLDKGTINFDILIATPAMMPKLGKYARLLGPKGLMPNPKSGTVTTSIASAVTGAKAGRVEYRVDPTGIVHVAVGKVSFGSKKLLENCTAIIESVRHNKPGSVKGVYMISQFITTTMGPSIKFIV